LKIDGASIVWLKQSKRLFFFQKFLLTNEEDNTNAPYVDTKPGYKVEDPLLRVSIS